MRKLYHKALEPTGALVSGGLDSMAMIARLARRHRRVVPIYIRQGLRWESAEIFWARKFVDRVAHPRIAPLTLLDLPIADAYESHWSLSSGQVPAYGSPDEEMFLPARNLLLAVKAAVFLSGRGIRRLALGVLRTNPFPDAGKSYIRKLAAVLSQSLGSPFRLLLPLQWERKWQVIRAEARLPLWLTLSCVNPVGRFHCGRCNKCAERQKAFLRAGVADETFYDGSFNKGTR